MRILNRFYYQKYIIKTLPENYVKFQQKVRKEQNEKSNFLDDRQLLKQVQKEQRKSLNIWLNYFLRKGNKYPMWFQYYAFRSMLQLNKYNKETGEFSKRSKTTTEKYIELNREALKMTYDTLSKIIGLLFYLVYIFLVMSLSINKLTFFYLYNNIVLKERKCKYESRICTCNLQTEI